MGLGEQEAWFGGQSIVGEEGRRRKGEETTPPVGSCLGGGGSPGVMVGLQEGPALGTGMPALLGMRLPWRQGGDALSRPVTLSLHPPPCPCIRASCHREAPGVTDEACSCDSGKRQEV